MSARAERLPGVGEKFVAGDSLRGICALVVVTYHVALMVSGYQRFRGIPGSFEEHFGEIPGAVLVAIGFPSVYVFLTLSGYLVGRPFLRAYVLGKPQPRIRPYARNRLLRIVPLFALTWTLTWLLHLDLVKSARDIAEPYLFLQVYRPTDLSTKMVLGWTVDVEMVFYVVLPLSVIACAAMARRLGPWGRAWLFMIPLCIVSAISLKLRMGTSGTPEFFQPQTIVFGFLPGLALALFEPLVAPKLRAGADARWVIRGLAVVAVAAVIYQSIAGYFDDWFHLAGILLATGVVGVPLIRQWAGSPTPGFLSGGWLEWIGIRAYSLYLLHMIIRDAALPIPEHIVDPWPALIVSLIVVFAVSIPVAALSYHHIEMRFLRLKRHRGSFVEPTTSATNVLPQTGTPAAAKQAGSVAP